MTVAELIELLKTFPQELPVTGYHGGEDTGFVTGKGVRLESGDKCGIFDHLTGERYTGPYVDIMGF